MSDISMYDGTFSGPTSVGIAGTNTGARDITTVGTAGQLVDRGGGSFNVNSSNQLIGNVGAGGYTLTWLDFDNAVSAGAIRSVYYLPADGSRANLWLAAARNKASNSGVLINFNGTTSSNTTLYAAFNGVGSNWYTYYQTDIGGAWAQGFPPTNNLIVTFDDYQDGPGCRLVMTIVDVTTGLTYGPHTLLFETPSSCWGLRNAGLCAAGEMSFSHIQIYSIPNPNVGVFCIGDSRTAGVEVTGTNTATGQTYPGVMLSALGAGFDAYNLGVAGQSVGDGAGAGTGMLATAPAMNYPLVDISRPANVAVVWGGVNDGPRDATAIYNDLVALCQGLRTAGFKVVICTEISAGGYDTYKNAINSSIRSNFSTFADGVADFGATALGADNAYLNLTYFNSDQIHPTAAGYAILGLVAESEVQLVVTPPVTNPPTFSPTADSYTSIQTVSISTTTSSATIRYTLDGTTPTSSNGTIYTTPITISTTQTLKAIAYKNGYTNSSVTSGVYTINITLTTYPNIHIVNNNKQGNIRNPYLPANTVKYVDNTIDLREYKNIDEYPISHTYTLAGLPSASTANLSLFVFVVDASLGQKLKYSDGSSWYNIQYNDVVINK